MNIKNEKGITLVALIVSIIVMLILATVTLNTTFTAYETTRAEKFKAQLKVVQESVNSFYSDWQTWKTEKEYEYRDEIRKKELDLEKALKGKSSLEEIAQIKAEYAVPEEQKLLEDGSMPQYFYDNIAGIDEYINYKNGTTSEEEKISGKTLGDLKDITESGQEDQIPIVNEECYIEVKAKLDEIMGREDDFSGSEETGEENNGTSEENNYRNVDDTIFYEFNEESLEKVLGLRDIDIPVFIDFENLVVFTTKPVRVSGKNIYTQYSFNDSGEIILNDTNSTMAGASILIDVKANYGTSQKITLTLESGIVNDDADKNNYVDYRIRKAYYQNAFSTYDSVKDNATEWEEVDNLKECEYSEDGKSVTFIVYESGYYRFRLEDVSGAYTVEMKKNTKMNIKNPNNQYSYEKIEDKNIDLDDAIEKAVYNITLCNAPVLNEDMIPVKWIYDDESKKDGKWVVCTTIDPEWYNYSGDSKLWANVMMSYDTLGTGLSKGTELSEKQMGSMFVWIPRFACKGGGRNSLVFLRGASNTNTFGKAMYAGSDADKAFTNEVENGGWDIQLRGLWFAKYDTSLEYIEDSGKIQMVNSSVETTAANFNKIFSSEQSFRPVSKPYRVTWRNISFSSAFSQSLMYYSKLPSASKNRDLNSHIMKASEWLALSHITDNLYLGIGSENLKANVKNKYSSGSDGINSFSVANCTNQTSNGNMTGIFDVIGTTKVMLPDIDIIEVDSDIRTHPEYIYNNNGEPINRAINEEIFIKYPNKYMSLLRNKGMTDCTIRLAENGTLGISDEWKTIAGCVNQDVGFRIVLANSASSDRDNFIYDNVNITEIASEDLPGFYVTDENGDYIRNEFGEYKDSNGNPTFYSWATMMANGWINLSSGTLNAGSNISQLKSKTGILILSDDVVTIGDNCFEGWNSDTAIDSGNKGLLKLVMQNKVTTVGKYAFRECRNLYEIDFSDVLKDINDSAFSYCSNLVNFSFPISLEVIGMGAFFECTSIESITIPYRVEKIGGEAFCKNHNLSSLQFQSEVDFLDLGTYCFTNSNITNVVIPGNISIIPACTFFGCKKLEKVVIEEGVEMIGSNAFGRCTSLKDINFPKTIKNIGESKFANAGGVFSNCVSLEKIDLQALTELKFIQAECFKGCTALTDIYLPITGLEFLGSEIFLDCPNLNYLKIPNSIKYFSIYTFGNEDSSSQKINLIYEGALNDWNNIKHSGSASANEHTINEWSRWYKNITIEVSTADGQKIVYDENDQT